jgi:hypothetical protein
MPEERSSSCEESSSFVLCSSIVARLSVRVELGLCRGGERAAGRLLGLRERGAQLRLCGGELLLAGVELRLPVGQLCATGVDLRLAVGDLLRLVGDRLLGLEGVDRGVDALEVGGLVEQLADRGLLRVREGVAVLGVEDHRAGAAGGARERLLELVGDLRRRRTGDGHGARQRAAEREERADRDAEDHDPGDEDGPRAARGEASEAIQQFSQGSLDSSGEVRGRRGWDQCVEP